MSDYDFSRGRWDRPADGQPDAAPIANPYANPYAPPQGRPFEGTMPPGPFAAPPMAPLRRDTTPLMGPPPPAAEPRPGYAAAPFTPVTPAPARRQRHGVRTLLLTAALILGLLAGGLGGGAAALLMSHSNTPSTASVATAPPAVINPQGVANANASAIHDLYSRVANSVVSIQVTLGGGGRFGAGGEGSGIVLDNTHILTNYHVVSGANTISIVLADGTSVTAQLAGSAPQDDLAVLTANLPADKVQAATLGNSDNAQIGDEVVAIGNPFGLDHTVTAGIISYVNRSWTDGTEPVHNMLQTDAPINPGNSGGALFNLQGEVIGVTTAIQSPVRGSVGVGFAIPINRAKSLLPQLTQGATVKRVMLGLQGMTMDSAAAAQLQVPVTKGVLTTGVVAGGPAANAGIIGADPTSGQVGDIVTAIDGHAVASISDLTSYLDGKQPGNVVTLTIWRAGKTQDVKVTLAPWQDQTQQNQTPQAPGTNPGP